VVAGFVLRRAHRRACKKKMTVFWSERSLGSSVVRGGLRTDVIAQNGLDKACWLVEDYRSRSE
jgi:hypothetical protein